MKRYVMVILFYSLLNVLLFIFLITICFCSMVVLMCVRFSLSNLFFSHHIQ